MSMTSFRRTVAFSLAPMLCLAACDQPVGEITRDTQPFGAVDATASISVLGTEPFWSLDIEPVEGGYEATYSSPEMLEGERFAVSRFAGNNGLGFSGEIDGVRVQLALTPGQCSDGMSDRTYPYTATVLRGETTLFGCGYTSAEGFTGEESP